jgi:hypothetical protein
MFLGAFGWRMPGQQSHADICGVVVDEHGGVEGALVVASGGGFNWVSTNPDGTFCIKTAGLFINVRHTGFSPILERTPAPDTSIRLRLVKASASVRAMPNCQSRQNSGRGWIGGGLRINPQGRYRGPVNGEHDTHWYVRRGKQSLHIVDGYLWHTGLPPENLLSASKSIDVRGWEFGKIAGLDLSGISQTGRRWRWIGAPVADAISYEDAAPEDAEYFDRILDSICFASR